MTHANAAEDLDGIGSRLTDVHDFVPYDLLSELISAKLNRESLFNRLALHEPRWRDGMARAVNSFPGGETEFYGTSEWRAAAQRERAVLQRIAVWLRLELVEGRLLMIGREDPLTGGLLLLNSGIAWARATFDFNLGLAHSPLRRGRIHDVRLALPGSWKRTGSEPDFPAESVIGKPPITAEKRSRYSSLDRRAVDRAMELIGAGLTNSAHDAAIRVFNEMQRAGTDPRDLGTSENATIKRWHPLISTRMKALQRSNSERS